jgi:hypothetical protein
LLLGFDSGYLFGFAQNLLGVHKEPLALPQVPSFLTVVVVMGEQGVLVIALGLLFEATNMLRQLIVFLFLSQFSDSRVAHLLETSKLEGSFLGLSLWQHRALYSPPIIIILIIEVELHEGATLVFRGWWGRLGHQ